MLCWVATPSAVGLRLRPSSSCCSWPSWSCAPSCTALSTAAGMCAGASVWELSCRLAWGAVCASAAGTGCVASDFAAVACSAPARLTSCTAGLADAVLLPIAGWACCWSSCRNLSGLRLLFCSRRTLLWGFCCCCCRNCWLGCCCRGCCCCMSMDHRGALWLLLEDTRRFAGLIHLFRCLQFRPQADLCRGACNSWPLRSTLGRLRDQFETKLSTNTHLTGDTQLR